MNEFVSECAYRAVWQRLWKVILKFPAPYAYMLTKISNEYHFFFYADRQKGNSLYSILDSPTFHKVCLKMGETWGSSRLENLNIGNFAKCTK